MSQTRSSRIARLVQGIEEGGGAIGPGLKPQGRPMDLVVDGEDFRVFSWRVSHGGKGRSPEEYRVQATRPDDMPLLDPARRTLLLGYHEELDVFAAWDARMHPNPSSSASLQVPLTILRRAAVEGFVAHSRLVGSETEIVVAFRPAATVTYLETAAQLPAPGASRAEVAASVRAGSGEAIAVEELPEGLERQRQIKVIEEKVRDERFRLQVLAAYGGCCAFCGLGGGLTQAAHIEGVGDGGPDLVVNGLCACPNHHAAFDRGLITVGKGNAVELSEEKLRARGSDAAMVERFRSDLLERLVLPPAAANHPDPARLAVHRERWR